MEQVGAGTAKNGTQCVCFLVCQEVQCWALAYLTKLGKTNDCLIN